MITGNHPSHLSLQEVFDVDVTVVVHVTDSTRITLESDYDEQVIDVDDFVATGI